MPTLEQLERERMTAINGHDPVLVRSLNRQIATKRASLERIEKLRAEIRLLKAQLPPEYLNDDDDDDPEVIQTACRHCGQDIENLAPFPAGEWRDRGNNWTCPTPEGDAGQVHEPIDQN